MSVNGKRKGKDGELDLCKYLRGLGFVTRRGQQFKGTADSPDVVLEGVYVECKRVEGLRPGTKLWEDAVLTVCHECGGNPWALFHRENGQPWSLTFWAADPGFVVTTTGNARVKEIVKWMQGFARGRGEEQKETTSGKA